MTATKSRPDLDEIREAYERSRQPVSEINELLPAIARWSALRVLEGCE